MAYQRESAGLGIPAQALHTTSAIQKADLGTRLTLADGREFVYAKAGGTDLVAGDLQQSAAAIADHEDLATNTAALGATSILVTPAATAGAADLYAGGYCVVTDDTGEGRVYRISGHAAITASTEFTLNLSDPIDVAFGAGTTVTLVHHPCKNTIVAPTTITGPIVGVAPIAVDVSVAEYYWMQVKGVCAVRANGTLVLGKPVIRGATTAGSVDVYDGADAGGVDQVTLGTCYIAPATVEKAAIMLDIPGW
jgi:hypothetical protein